MIKIKKLCTFILMQLILLIAFSKGIKAETFNIVANDTNALIDAINLSNNNGNSDIINLFENSSYELVNVNNNHTIYSKTGLPIIVSEITINGNGSKIYRQEFSPAFRIFAIQNPGKLTLNDLTINGGKSTHNYYGGGGILNFDGALVINESVISENTASTGGGGGIWMANQSSTLLTNTILSNNNVLTDASGGSIIKRGEGILTLINCSISNNYAENVGGAIYSNSTGIINIENCEIFNNNAKNQGGAIFNYRGNISIENSTFTENRAIIGSPYGLGGAIFNETQGNILINNTYFTDNQAITNGGFFYNKGVVEISNSCISGNTATSLHNQSAINLSAINNWWGASDGPSGIGPGSGDSISFNIGFNPFESSCPISTPEEVIPVVILPGLGGSWNTPALITGGGGGNWKEVPFIKAYDNLKNTFIDSAGYTEGDDYFEFYYDWRKPLDTLADEFKDYLENTVLADKPIDTKVNLVGHSMGGMVARTYGQRYSENNLNKIVTTGSPHEGAIKAWEVWSGAEVENRWSWQWIALQLYLHIHKGKYTSPISAVHNLSPSLNDLTPIFNFAKDQNDQEINVTTMNFSNNYLQNLKNTFDLKSIFHTIAGDNNETVEWIKLQDRSLIDKLLGKWPDGKPESYENTLEGDKTVLKKSSLINDTNQFLVNNNHAELVQTPEGIEAILDALEIEAIPVNSIASLPRNPSLLFFLHSPADIRVTAPGDFQAGYQVSSPMSNSIYSPNDKLLVIYDAEDGDYQIEVMGAGEGNYQLELGQLTESEEVWNSFPGIINNDEIDIYSIYFDSESPKDLPLIDDATGKRKLEIVIEQLENLKNHVSGQSVDQNYKDQVINYINRILRVANKGLSYLKADNYSRGARYVKVTMAGVYFLRIRNNNWVKSSNIPEEIQAYVNNRAEEIGRLALDSFISALNQDNKIIEKDVLREFKKTDRLRDKLMEKLQLFSGENYFIGNAFELLEDKYEKAQITLNDNDLISSYAHILVSKLLSLEILKMLR